MGFIVILCWGKRQRSREAEKQRSREAEEELLQAIQVGRGIQFGRGHSVWSGACPPPTLFWRTNGRHSRIDPFPSALGLVDLVTRHVSEGRNASTRSRFGFPKLPYFGETY